MGKPTLNARGPSHGLVLGWNKKGDSDMSWAFISLHFLSCTCTVLSFLTPLLPRCPCHSRLCPHPGPKQTLPSVSCFCQVFYHSKGESSQANVLSLISLLSCEGQCWWPARAGHVCPFTSFVNLKDIASIPEIYSLLEAGAILTS